MRCGPSCMPVASSGASSHADTPHMDMSDDIGARDRGAGLPAWLDSGRWLAAAIIVIALQWAAVTGDGWVGLLSYVDLGIHELGHMLFMWAPPVLHALGGTLLQAAAPLGLCLYFVLVRRDLFAGAIMLGWQAVALRNIAVYMADAPVRILPLLGGQDGHDWAYLFTEWGVLGHAQGIATFVEVVGFAAALAGFALAAYGFARPRLEARRRVAYEAHLRTLPVRQPRDSVSVDVDQ